MSERFENNWMEAVKVRVSLRYRMPPSQIAKLRWSEVLWMFAALAYEQEKLEESKDGQAL